MILCYTSLKRKTILLLVGLFCALSLTKAQMPWNKIYLADKPKLLFSSILSTDTTYFILGNTTTLQSPFYETGIVAKLNINGEIVNHITNSDTLTERTGFFWNTLTQTAKGQIVFSGNGADTGQHMTFGFIEEGFDSMKLFRYKSPNMFSYQGIALVEHPSNYFYVAGVHNIQSSFNANVLLIKIDSNGNKMWEKYYHQMASDYAKSLIVLANGNLMLGAERNNLNQTNVKSNTWLLEVDTGGNIVRQWFDPNDSTYVAEGLRQTQDGGFIYGARKKNYQSGFSPVSYNATIVKLDSNFNKQWTFIKGGNDLSIYSGITDIEELPDGSLVAAGHLTYYGTDTALNGYVVKLDVDGNVIWERNYRGINESQTLNFLSDIDILPDGGLIAVGQCQKSGATPPQVGWFLKLDSNGCEIDNCTVSFEEVQEEKQIEIYPNPTSDNFIIKLPESMKGAVVAVYDVTGKIVKQQTVNTKQLMIDVTAFSKGLYFVTAQKEERVLSTKLVVE